jgi:hypothetical protein
MIESRIYHEMKKITLIDGSHLVCCVTVHKKKRNQFDVDVELFGERIALKRPKLSREKDINSCLYFNIRKFYRDMACQPCLAQHPYFTSVQFAPLSVATFDGLLLVLTKEMYKYLLSELFPLSSPCSSPQVFLIKA